MGKIIKSQFPSGLAAVCGDPILIYAFLLSVHFQQSKHRHRRENGDGEGGESPTGGGSDDGELENFIALAPDEADIYNFSNNLINGVDNGGGGGGGTENANEVNPFNEFLNPRHSSHQQQQQQQQHRQMQGKQQLPEDPWGLDLDEQLPPPEEAQQEEEAENEVEKSKYLSSGSSLEPVNRSQQPAGGSPLMASSIDFLNSIDGGYLLSNGIIDEKGTKLIDGKFSLFRSLPGARSGENFTVDVFFFAFFLSLA